MKLKFSKHNDIRQKICRPANSLSRNSGLDAATLLNAILMRADHLETVFCFVSSAFHEVEHKILMADDAI